MQEARHLHTYLPNVSGSFLAHFTGYTPRAFLGASQGRHCGSSQTATPREAARNYLLEGKNTLRRKKDVSACRKTSTSFLVEVEPNSFLASLIIIIIFWSIHKFPTRYRVVRPVNTTKSSSRAVDILNKIRRRGKGMDGRGSYRHTHIGLRQRQPF